MIAPSIDLPGTMPTKPPRPARGALHGIARHVSAEGCQFALSGQPPEPGRRLAMELDGGTHIEGTVRWVVEDRIGFEFDGRLGPALVAELTSHLALLKVTRLLTCSQPLPAD